MQVEVDAASVDVLEERHKVRSDRPRRSTDHAADDVELPRVASFNMRSNCGRCSRPLARSRRCRRIPGDHHQLAWRVRGARRAGLRRLWSVRDSGVDGDSLFFHGRALCFAEPHYTTIICLLYALHGSVSH